MNDAPRWVLAKGGEGSGKSVAGIVKSLYKLSRGLSPGVMGSTDYPHFGRSLWPEFRRWCPWDYVIPSQRRRASLDWSGNGEFEMIFDRRGHGQVVLICTGFQDPTGWHGPNLNFAHFDEARRHKTPAMLKVLDGRIRIPGPKGEPPQGYITTTPKKHWLFDYFGPIKEADPLAAFKSRSTVLDLYTRDNEANLEPGYTDVRRGSLTEAEARIFLEAAWEDEDETSPFLPSMTVWDACRETAPNVDMRRWPMVVALDAGLNDDLFGLVGVTRHPAKGRDLDVFTWITRTWKKPKDKKEIQYDDVMDELDRLMAVYNIMEVCYDPYQLAYFAQKLREKGKVMVTPFNQSSERAVADKQLRDMILQRRLAHTGQADLREHMLNADQKRDAGDRTLRLVKRSQDLKIDLVVALSMATARCMELPL